MKEEDPARRSMALASFVHPSSPERRCRCHHPGRLEGRRGGGVENWKMYLLGQISADKTGTWFNGSERATPFDVIEL